MKSPLRLALALAVAAVFSPAMAQEVIGTLTVEQGTVMTSTGGEFTSATSGEAIQVGEQIMVSEGASASVTFSNGVVSNLTVGVHTISGLPAAATAGATAGSVGTAGGASVAATVGVIAGTAAAVAAASEAANDDKAPDQPVSR